MIVRHKAYGEGSVKSISDTIIEVEFGEQRKKFQFPRAFDLVLSTDDPELQARVTSAKEKTEKDLKAAKEASPSTKQFKRDSLSNNVSPRPGFSYKPKISSPLVGGRAQTISVRSEAEMFELIGYMAAPGRVSSVEAEVPKDGRDTTFESLFPGQKYRPIELGDTPSGMPNKISPQFRINFANLKNCPEPLRKNMGKGNGSCAGRINKSKFVLDIVQNYGFRFGDRQDTSVIRDIAEKRGYLVEFEKGFRR